MSSSASPRRGSAMEQAVRSIWPGLLAAQSLCVVCRLGIPDLLAVAPKTLTDLAAATGTHAPSLRRLLRAMSPLEVFAEDDTGRFSNTAAGETLRRDHPNFFRSNLMMLTSPFCWRPLGDMYESIRTGESSFSQIYGRRFFDYLADNPEDSEIFNASQTAQHNPATISVVTDGYDFSRFSTIVDVGGGHGALLQGLLGANPGLRGILFDLPEVVAGAKPAPPALAGRFETVGGDFFDSVPRGADTYMIRCVLGDWKDEDALRILKSCRRAIPPNGTLVLLETVVESRDGSANGGWGDLLMFVLNGGCERTVSDLEALLVAAGFSAPRLTKNMGLSILESHPV